MRPVALFCERAQAIDPRFAPTDAELRAVAEICTYLDGLPLAIELAAARSKLLPPPLLWARLQGVPDDASGAPRSGRLHLLTDGARDLPARQRTLRSTLAWSFNLLDPAARRLFARLSVCVSGCTLDAAETIGAGDRAVDVLGALTSLIDTSLLRRAEHPADIGGGWWTPSGHAGDRPRIRAGVPRGERRGTSGPARACAVLPGAGGGRGAPTAWRTAASLAGPVGGGTPQRSRRAPLGAGPGRGGDGAASGGGALAILARTWVLARRVQMA